jgi:hypothetical protein
MLSPKARLLDTYRDGNDHTDVAISSSPPSRRPIRAAGWCAGVPAHRQAGDTFVRATVNLPEVRIRVSKDILGKIIAETTSAASSASTCFSDAAFSDAGRSPACWERKPLPRRRCPFSAG